MDADMDADPGADRPERPKVLQELSALIRAARPHSPEEHTDTTIDDDHTESFSKEHIERLVSDEVDKAFRAASPSPVDTPFGCKVELLPHQKQGLGYLCKWIKDPAYHGGIVADDMGLGKAFLMISALLNTQPS
jgi:SNF2 family DNA or RNA helicase